MIALPPSGGARLFRPRCTFSSDARKAVCERPSSRNGLRERRICSKHGQRVECSLDMSHGGLSLLMGKAQCPGSFRKKIHRELQSEVRCPDWQRQRHRQRPATRQDASAPAGFCLATEIQMRNGRPVGSLDTLLGSVIDVRQIGVFGPGIRRQFDGAHRIPRTASRGCRRQRYPPRPRQHRRCQ